ncbi:uncharacterized protein UDID_18849 [Ustilago sp. UG-2017a]|nr:uncharacterized protein UDID_18849 [Ustilago sp. UG-2017a]
MPTADHGLPWSTLLWIDLIPDTYAPTIRTSSLLATCTFRPMTPCLYLNEGEFIWVDSYCGNTYHVEHCITTAETIQACIAAHTFATSLEASILELTDRSH